MSRINWASAAIDALIITAAWQSGNWWILLLTFCTGGYVMKERDGSNP